MIEPGQLKAARRQRGLSQAELARLSGVSQSLIAKIEAGKVDPTFSKMKAISAALAGGDGRASEPAARDVMSSPVVSMFADEALEVAIAHLSRHGFSQLPVLDHGRLVGTVTEAALVGHMQAHHGDPAAMARPVREVLSEPMPLVPPATGLEALESLLQLFPGVLVSANGRVQGIVTRADVLRAGSPATAATPEPLSRI